MARSKNWKWVDYSDEQLLDLRLCDLKLKLADTGLQRYVDRLYADLENRGISFRPHVWLSNEWFTPDGVGGIALPFYIAHPRLSRLELAQVLDVEGGDPRWCMQLLRHECGHAIDNAFQLRRRRKRQQLFGKSSEPYSDYYTPRPFSRRYVHHLDTWYAQSHPDEDFAETFALWLTPRSGWRKRYARWPALAKLEYMDELMQELAGVRPTGVDRSKIAPLSELRTTLREHYRERRTYLGLYHPDYFKGDLDKLFSPDAKHSKNMTALAFLRQSRKQARRVVARWTGIYQYTIDQVIADMVSELQQTPRWLTSTPEDTLMQFVSLLTIQTMNYIQDESHRVPR